jgi:hypothetical protein
MDYLERQYRITGQTLAAQAQSSLDALSSSRADLDFWYPRIASAIKEKPLDSNLTIAKSRYEAEVYFKIDDAIATCQTYLDNCKIAGKLDSEYADGLFWLASYTCRKIDTNRNPGPRNYDPVFTILGEAVKIRPNSKSWLLEDDDFRNLKGMERFDNLFK